MNSEWNVCEQPKRKADYVHKYLRLEDAPPPQVATVNRFYGAQYKLPIKAGAVLQILARRNAKDTAHVVSIPNVSHWGDIRILELRWCCPYCYQVHSVMIPESWLDEGKAVFVE